MHLNSQTGSAPWLAFSNLQRWTYLAVLFLVATSSYIDRGILTVLLEPIKREFGLSDRTLGLLGGAPFAICYALSSIPLALAADRGGRKKVLIAAMIAWTLMTALCGIAGSLFMLFIGRMGVGAAEGGSIPPAHALIADYFPPERRTTAFGVFTAANVFGLSISTVAGGWIAQNFGWRAAFLLMALVSAPIILFALAILKEPAAAPRKAKAEAKFFDELKILFRKRSFPLIVAGSTFLAAFATGPMIFVPSYMVRKMGLDLAEVGAAYGLAATAGSLIGTFGGGILGDRMAAAGRTSPVLLPALLAAIAFPLGIATFMVQDLSVFLVLICCLIAIVFGTLPPIYAAAQFVCGPTRRAIASAVVMGTLNAFGMTLGPLMTGVLSDFYGYAGADSIRYAIITMTAVLPPASLLLYLASRHLANDAE